MSVAEVRYEIFDLAADAFDWLDENCFRQCVVQPTVGQLDFEHRDGRRAILFLPPDEIGDQESEVRIFPAPSWRKFGT